MPRRALSLVLILAASAAAAQPPSEADRRELEQRRDRSAAEAAEVRREIDALAEQLSRLAAEQARDGDDISEERARLNALNEREVELSARLGANRSRLSRLLGALQMYGKHPPPALFVHPDDAKDAVRAAILIRAVTPDLRARAELLAGEVEAARQVRREVAAVSEGLFLTESEFAERTAEIERLIAEKEALEDHLIANLRAAERDLNVLSARIQTLRGAAPAPAPSARVRLTMPDELQPPVAGAPVRRFGQSAGRGRLEGWAYAPPAGGQVRAPARGRVEYAGPLNGWNNVLILDLGEGHLVVLAGVGAVMTSAGEVVEAGAIVGQMPSDGANGAAELYVEVRKDGEPQDPARFFAAIGQ